jgi:hypothetical protein
MTNKIFNLKNLIWFCAIGLAVFSGYYSIFGISKLFSGGSWSILGMAAMLELSKLVVVTFLHDHFKTLRLLFKGYLLSAAVVLMLITSIGVYGYLTNSYQETAKIVYKAQNEIILLDQKKELFIKQKAQIDKLIEEKNGRLKSLDNIRVSQQNAYTEQLTQKRGTGNLSRSMSSVDKTTESLNTELSQLTQKSFALSDSIAKIDATKLTVSNETFSSELGPLLYLSRITGIPMDNVVNWFILILVIVFDPLAVSLVIAANHLSDKEKKKYELEDIVESFPTPVNDQITDSVTQTTPTEGQTVVLDELTEIAQEMGMYDEGMDVVIIPQVEETFEEPQLVVEEPTEEVPLGDIVDVKKIKSETRKRKSKRLKNTEKVSILNESPIKEDVNVKKQQEQKVFYDEGPKYSRGITP